MGNTERIWLQTAALLHDIGKSIGGKDHHKKSRDLIVKSAKLPVTKKEKKIIALVARYHRGIKPRRYHKYYRKLDAESRNYVKKLAALLRIADALDSNHQRDVFDLFSRITDEYIAIHPQTSGYFDSTKVVFKADLLEEVFNRDLNIIDELEPASSNEDTC
jgi:exopolyphosphatase/guanosine-5'-triphosphate,3'-diphosphate pyrophosphatase